MIDPTSYSVCPVCGDSNIFYGGVRWRCPVCFSEGGYDFEGRMVIEKNTKEIIR